MIINSLCKGNKHKKKVDFTKEKVIEKAVVAEGQSRRPYKEHVLIGTVLPSWRFFCSFFFFGSVLGCIGCM